MTGLSWPEWWRARRFDVARIIGGGYTFEQLMESREGVAVAQYLQPTMIVGDLPTATTKGSATLNPALVDSNGRLLTNSGISGVSPGSDGAGLWAEASSTPVDASGPTVTFAVITEVDSVYCSAVCDGTVASRNFRGQSPAAERVDVGTAPSTPATSNLTLTASESGSILRVCGETVETTNDAGTMALVTGQAPFPRIRQANETVLCEINTNVQVGDRLGISVMARRVA